MYLAKTSGIFYLYPSNGRNIGIEIFYGLLISEVRVAIAHMDYIKYIEMFYVFTYIFYNKCFSSDDKSSSVIKILHMRARVSI